MYPTEERPLTKILSNEVMDYLKDDKIIEVTYRKKINYDLLRENGVDVISVHLSQPLVHNRTLLTYNNLKIDRIIRAYHGNRMVLILNDCHHPSSEVLQDWNLVETLDNVQIWERLNND
jgi:hypothetical protein